jgi:hypothetical protein
VNDGSDYEDEDEAEVTGGDLSGARGGRGQMSYIEREIVKASRWSSHEDGAR